MSTLDEAIELVEVTPLPDHEDIQLLPGGENESLASEEVPIDLTHQEEIDDDKDPGVTEPTWESIHPTPDPTPDPSISYLSNTDICLPVRSEGPGGKWKIDLRDVSNGESSRSPRH
ncbi:hypothetical protein V8E54_003172 [Elaphomyces granulatus]